MWTPNKKKQHKIAEYYRRELIKMGMAETEYELKRNIEKDNFKKVVKRLKIK